MRLGLATLLIAFVLAPSATAQGNATGDDPEPHLDDGSDVLETYDASRIGEGAEDDVDGSDVQSFIRQVEASGENDDDASKTPSGGGGSSGGDRSVPAPGLALAGLAVAGAACFMARRR